MAAAICEAREMFLTNHALVLASLAGDPGLRMRDIADRVGVTERAVESIVRDLTAGGYLTKVRNGRRNRYRLHLDRPFQHPLVSHRSLSRLVQALVPDFDGHTAPAGTPTAETPPEIPETSISCAGPRSTLILHETGQSGAEGGSVKRVLVYIAVASVMALATAAAAAAISRRSNPQPTPRHHLTRRVATAPVATAPVVAPGTSVAADGPTRLAVRRLHPAPRHTRIAHWTPPLRPVRGGAPAGGQPVSAPTPPSVSAGTTVAVGTRGAGATVTAGNGGVTATAGSPVGSVGVSLGTPSHGGAPVVGVDVGSLGP